jgi:branched-chain amino acid transport system permease protein
VSTFELIVQQLFNALTIGSLYAEAAIGLAMVFGILNLINFAHGDILMLGAYGIVLALSIGFPFWAAVVLGIVGATLAGLLMERIAYRPLRGAPDVALLLTSFAVTILIENGIILTVSANPKPFPMPPLLNGFISIGNLRFPTIDATVIVGTLVLLLILTFLVTRTRIGIAMRATASDLVGAHLCGIDINRVVVFAFAVGSAIAGVAGIGWAGRIGKVDPFMGLEPVLKGFVAVVFGGFGSIPGAVLGAYILGGMEVLFTAFLPTEYALYRNAYVFIVLIIVLLLRPSGLLGTRTQEKL